MLCYLKNRCILYELDINILFIIKKSENVIPIENIPYKRMTMLDSFELPRKKKKRLIQSSYAMTS